jgi:NADPH2:quinone reductase
MAEYGGYAERVRVHRSQCYVLPGSLSCVDAAAMSLAFDTAWVALSERGRLSKGESVLVLGATGAVGSAAVQLARAMGAGQILGAGTSPDRLVAEGHVDRAVDLGGQDLRESVRRQVMAATEGRGVDVIIDAVGGDAFDGAIRSLAWRGRLVIVGFAAGRIPSLKMNYPLLKNIEISGLQISDYRKRAPDLMAQCFGEIFRFHQEGVITAPSSITLPLNEWQHAMAMVDERTTVHRVLLTPG